MNMRADNRPVVAHSVETWLPLTMTWVYNLLKYSTRYRGIVLADRTENAGQFPFEPVCTARGVAGLAFRVLKRFGMMTRPFSFDAAIARHRPAILHSHFGNRGWTDLPLAKRHRLRHVVTFYGYDVGMLPKTEPAWGKRYKEMFGRADLVLCEGPHMAGRIVDLGCPPEKVKVQVIGADTGHIRFMPRKIGGDGLIKILIAGSFREKKGIPYALEAVGMIKDRHPNIRVTVVGGSTGQPREEEEKDRILKTVSRYGLGGIIRMPGFQPHSRLMEEAYDSHIFLSPSVTSRDGDTEGGSPVAITEAAASGMPVVSTWHCDIPEVVKDGVTGFLADERDAEGLAAALEKMVNASASWAGMGRAARDHVEANFSLNRAIPDLQRIYGDL